MKKVTFSVIGFGGRANVYLTALQKHFKGEFELVAIAEPDKRKQQKYQEMYQVSKENIFDTDLDFLEKDRLSDVAIVATQDDIHLQEVIRLLEKGYDIILEKPVASKYEDVIELLRVAKQYPNQHIVVCHVLRYTNFFKKIKEIIDSKRIGNVVTIQHNENIGFYHFAHSYVRGQWRKSDESSPLIVAKSCHDMDIMLYLLGNKRTKKISSFGSLSFFNHMNYDPKIMAPNCFDCSIEKQCPYSALKIYGTDKIKSIVFDKSSIENFNKDLKHSQYSRCVFDSDNDVVDHQATIIEFDGGITATFNLSAFTSKVNRTLKVMCEYGEIRAREKPYLIEIHDFRTDTVEEIDLKVSEGGHGGGDENFIIDFMKQYRGDKQFLSTLDVSIESHIMAFQAEYSRLQGGQVVNIEHILKSLNDI